jgi:hypothetical protein
METTTTIAAPTEVAPATPTPAPASTSIIDGEGNFTGNWKEQLLDENVRGEKFFDSDYAKNVKNLLKKAYHNEKLLGEYTSGKKRGVVVPKEGSPPEEVQAFRDATGVPKEYKFNRPEDIDESVVTSDFMTGAMKKLNEANLNQKQFDTVMEIFTDRLRSFEKEGIDTLNSRVQGAVDRIQKEWGDKFEARTDLAKRFVGKMTDKWPAEKYQELFGVEAEGGLRTGGINDPEFSHLRPLLLDLFATIEETYGIPDSAALSDTFESKAQTLEEELQTLEATPGFKEGRLRTSANPLDRQKHEDIMKKRKDLIQRQTELKNKVSR